VPCYSCVVIKRVSIRLEPVVGKGTEEKGEEETVSRDDEFSGQVS
jgi:hypothetical protein